jgi:hypothetical protein
VRFGCVLADSGYGSSGTFRQALSERGLKWAVGLSRRQNVYRADVGLIFPVAKAGRPRTLMTMIAYAFLQSRRLKAAGRKKKNRGAAASTDSADHQASYPRHFRAASECALPAL